MGSACRFYIPALFGARKKLIERAVGAVHGDTPPADLRLAWDCEKWRALPDDGGLNSQDYRKMRSMTMLSNVYDTVSYLRNLKGAEIHRLTNSQRRLIRWLMDEGISVNG